MNKLCSLLLMWWSIAAAGELGPIEEKKAQMNNPLFHVIDLTHTISARIPTWLGDCGFTLQQVLDYAECTGEFKFRVHKFALHASAGTHMDAPAHCIEGSATIDQLPVENFVAPAVVIDVSDKADEKYMVTLDDIVAFESTYGEIQPGTLVFIRTGWEKFWSAPEKYRNNHMFPSVSPDVAELLVQKRCVGLGIDTLSADRPDNGFKVHNIILGAGKYLVENVANLAMLPPVGAHVIVTPLKIEGATESPIRLLALLMNNQ